MIIKGDNLSCIRFVLATDENAIKHIALCSGERLRRKAVICLPRHAGHRVFDTVSPELDYIEAKSKTVLDKASGVINKSMLPAQTLDMVNDDSLNEHLPLLMRMCQTRVNSLGLKTRYKNIVE